MKPKKNKVVAHTSLMSLASFIFSFIYMNIIKLLFKHHPAEVDVIQQDKTAKTTKKIQKALAVVSPQPKPIECVPPPAIQEATPPSIPLLKFSIAIEKKPIIAAAAKEVIAVRPSNPIIHRETHKDILLGNIALTMKIKANHKLLRQMTNIHEPTQPLATLIHQLAFVYRFHILLMSLKVLMIDGAAREDFYHARSLLVHNTDNFLLNLEVLSATQAALMNIDLSEIDELNYFKQKLTGEKFTAAIKALPLCRVLNHQLDVQPVIKAEQLSKWLESAIIPLLNAIDGYARNKDFPTRQECMDACKMVSIIAGEFCQPSKQKYNKKPSNMASFANLCLKNRKQFAHYALTNKINHNNNALIALGKRITTNKIKDEQLQNCLSPCKHQQANHITHQSDTNYSTRSATL